MSRTYRRHRLSVCTECLKERGRWHHNPKYDECQCEEPAWFGHYETYQLYLKDGRDSKPWYKPDADHKRTRQQRYRAQCKQALYNHVYKGKDYIPPVNKMTDIWEWT